MKFSVKTAQYIYAVLKQTWQANCVHVRPLLVNGYFALKWNARFPEATGQQHRRYGCCLCCLLTSE